MNWQIFSDSDLQAIWSGLMARLGAIPSYVTMFEAAYPGTAFADMTFAHAANAIAGFEIRAFPALDSPWEQFVAGDDYALKSSQLKGARAFFESGCATCHSGSQLADFDHHNTALAPVWPGQRRRAHRYRRLRARARDRRCWRSLRLSHPATGQRRTHRSLRP